MNANPSDRLILFGRICYGAGIAALGLQHFVIAGLVPVILPSLPAWIPIQAAWPYLFGAALFAMGGAILLGQRARATSLLLGYALLAALVLRHIPAQVASGVVSPLAVWNNPLKLLTLAGGAFAVAASIPPGGAGATNRMFTALGCFALAVTCALFGFEHFQYVQFVADLVPSWVPGHVFWTYFCGAALMAAGAGMLLRIVPRLASLLLGWMIFAWFLVLHIPRAIADPHSGHGNEWSSVFEALAFSGISFILSQTLPRKAR
jgi:uncharacterized membrane protein